jgi:prolipoprotein diacylglyceryltransferase
MQSSSPRPQFTCHGIKFCLLQLFASKFSYPNCSFHTSRYHDSYLYDIITVIYVRFAILFYFQKAHKLKYSDFLFIYGLLNVG